MGQGRAGGAGQGGAGQNRAKLVSEAALCLLGPCGTVLLQPCSSFGQLLSEYDLPAGFDSATYM